MDGISGIRAGRSPLSAAGIERSNATATTEATPSARPASASSDSNIRDMLGWGNTSMLDFLGSHASSNADFTLSSNQSYSIAARHREFAKMLGTI